MPAGHSAGTWVQNQSCRELQREALAHPRLLCARVPRGLSSDGSGVPGQELEAYHPNIRANRVFPLDAQQPCPTAHTGLHLPTRLHVQRRVHTPDGWEPRRPPVTRRTAAPSSAPGAAPRRGQEDAKGVWEASGPSVGPTAYHGHTASTGPPPRRLWLRQAKSPRLHRTERRFPRRPARRPGAGLLRAEKQTWGQPGQRAAGRGQGRSYVTRSRPPAASLRLQEAPPPAPKAGQYLVPSPQK